jgi:mannose-6-phosphate isomerase-like protein (cupin superfamily)
MPRRGVRTSITVGSGDDFRAIGKVVSTTGERMPQDFAHIPPSEGRSLWVFGELVTFKTTGQQTGGAYSLFEVTSHPGIGPPPHVQHREEEAFWVLEGGYEFLIEGRTLTASPGALIYVPKGTLHTHKNLGEGVSRMLVTQTPGGLSEKFFEETGLPGTGLSSASPAYTPEELQRMVELGRKYGIEYPPPTVG